MDKKPNGICSYKSVLHCAERQRFSSWLNSIAGDECMWKKLPKGLEHLGMKQLLAIVECIHLLRVMLIMW